MKIATTAALAATTAILSGCAGIKTTCEYDDNFNFQTVETYQWIDAPDKIMNEEDTFLSPDMQNALRGEFARRGWRQVGEPSEADVQATYYIKLASHEEYTSTASPDEPEFSGGFVYNPENGNWNYRQREPDLNVYTIETGTLIVLISDTRSGDRIWRGTLDTRIDRSLPRERMNRFFQTIARKIMEPLPRK